MKFNEPKIDDIIEKGIPVLVSNLGGKNNTWYGPVKLVEYDNSMCRLYPYKDSEGRWWDSYKIEKNFIIDPDRIEEENIPDYEIIERLEKKLEQTIVTTPLSYMIHKKIDGPVDKPGNIKVSLTIEHNNGVNEFGLNISENNVGVIRLSKRTFENLVKIGTEMFKYID